MATKQEIIKEGMTDILRRNAIEYYELYRAAPAIEFGDFCREIVNKLLKFEDSQGCVLKKEGGLPEKVLEEINEVAERYALRPNYANELIGKILDKAGYTLTESLI